MISLGTEVAWVALPGEIFVQLGIAIKDGSPFATVSIHELANGSVGYVPTQQRMPKATTKSSQRAVAKEWRAAGCLRPPATPDSLSEKDFER